MAKISVVMTTWNGEKYVQRQLDSLRGQELAPDEVLIFDDCSSDGTVRLIESYIQCHGLRGWKVFVNPQNLGWKKNFMQGAGKTTGEFIFFSDQDDRWDSGKIKKMAEALEKNSQINLLACDYRVVLEGNAAPPRVYSKKEAEKAGKVARYCFCESFFQNPSPGCTYALRKSFFGKVSPLWFDGAPHDEFLWLMAAVGDSAFFYNEPLMDYIRTGDNASVIHYKDIPAQKENLRYMKKTLEQLQLFAERNALPDARVRFIRNAGRWVEKREKLMDTRNPLRWLALFPMWGYYNSFKNCLSDLYLVLFGSFSRK